MPFTRAYAPLQRETRLLNRTSSNHRTNVVGEHRRRLHSRCLNARQSVRVQMSVRARALVARCSPASATPRPWASTTKQFTRHAPAPVPHCLRLPLGFLGSGGAPTCPNTPSAVPTCLIDATRASRSFSYSVGSD